MNGMELQNKIRWWLIRKLLNSKERLYVWESMTAYKHVLETMAVTEKYGEWPRASAEELTEIKLKIAGKTDYEKWS